MIRHKGVRICLLAIAHSIVFVAVYWFAMLLRWEFQPPPRMVDLFLRSVPWFIAIKLPVFFLLGHYHGWWRYVAFSDVSALILSLIHI